MLSKIQNQIYRETHGSGLNYDYDFKVVNNRLRLKTYFATMDEMGGYAEVVPVTVYWDLNGNGDDFKVCCRNTGGNCYGLRSYLEDVFESINF